MDDSIVKHSRNSDLPDDFKEHCHWNDTVVRCESGEKMESFCRVCETYQWIECYFDTGFPHCWTPKDHDEICKTCGDHLFYPAHPPKTARAKYDSLPPECPPIALRWRLRPSTTELIPE